MQTTFVLLFVIIPMMIFAVTTGSSKAQSEASSFFQENARPSPDDSKDLYDSYHPEKATPHGDPNALYDSYHPNLGPKGVKSAPETPKSTPIQRAK